MGRWRSLPRRVCAWVRRILNDQINLDFVRLHVVEGEKKRTNVKFGSHNVHWVWHCTHVASLAADIIRRRRVASPAASYEPYHKTSDQGHPDDTSNDAPRDSASIRVTLGRSRRICPGRNSGMVASASRARDIGSAACNFGRICDRADSTSHERYGSLAQIRTAHTLCQ